MEKKDKSDDNYLWRGKLDKGEVLCQSQRVGFRTKARLSALMGCCVYFSVSAKFILFSASFSVVSSPIESQRVHLPPSLVPGWLHVRALAGSGTSNQIAIGV